MKFGLVACSKTKSDQPAPARDLYQGTLFQRASAYAERTCDFWYVLSAKHGLVHPSTILEPYDASLHDLENEQRRQWAARVLKGLEGLEHHTPYWIVLAGETYREFLIPELPGTIEVPLSGIGIGEQIKWLGDELSKFSRRCRICEVAIPTHPGGLCSGCQAYATAMHGRHRRWVEVREPVPDGA